VSGDVSVRHLDLAPLLKDPKQKSDVTADAKVDLKAESFANLDSLRGTASLTAPRLAAAGYAAENVKANARFEGRRVALNASAGAYGAAATATGQVTIPQGTDPLTFDLRGRARRLDLRALPKNLNVPPAETNVNADYHVAGSLIMQSAAAGERGAVGTGGDITPNAGGPAKAGRHETANAGGPAKAGRHDASGADSAAKSGNTARRAPAQTLRIRGDAQFVDSTVAGARIENGSRIGLEMDGGRIAYNADATVSGLDLQRIGREFNVPALADDRYKTTINGHVVANGSGTTPREMNLTANGTLSDSTLMGGRVPQLTFDATVANDAAHVTASGSFADFDPAVASGKPAMKGNVGGALDVDATIEGLSAGVTPDNVAGSAKMTLEQSTIGGLAIDSASLDADYHNQSGEIRDLTITGRDLNATASGTLALNDSGESNLTFHADTPSLETLGKLVDTPVSGIAKVDGTLTGNRRELKASGTLVGNGVKYQDNGALSLNADYSVTIPDLTVERATADADTHATFVTIAGQNINDLTAKTSYVNKELTSRRRPSSRSARFRPAVRLSCIPIIRKCTSGASASMPDRCSGRSRMGKRRRSITPARRSASRTCGSPAATNRSPPTARSAVPATLSRLR
jgi:hypothetical protein